MNQYLPPVNHTSIQLNASGLHFQFVDGSTQPGIPIYGAVVQTTSKKTAMYNGYSLEIEADMIGAGAGRSYDYVVLTPEGTNGIKSITFCDTPS
jgi:hypothetical protein